MIEPQMALVVEDDALQRELLSDVLRLEQMDVIECGSAESAELVLSRTGLQLALLITDVELAGKITGLELVQFARARFPDLKVVIISGHDDLPIPVGARFLHKRGTAIQRLYPHPPHQRLHMTTADLAPIGSQQPSQHPRAGEGKLQMQLVDLPHDREVGVWYRPRQVVDAATADAQNLRLPGDRCSRSIIALRSAIPPW
jgi:CheY-like chemotaxis protein